MIAWMLKWLRMCPAARIQANNRCTGERTRFLLWKVAWHRSTLSGAWEWRNLCSATDHGYTVRNWGEQMLNSYCSSSELFTDDIVYTWMFIWLTADILSSSLFFVLAPSAWMSLRLNRSLRSYVPLNCRDVTVFIPGSFDHVNKAECSTIKIMLFVMTETICYIFTPTLCHHCCGWYVHLQWSIFVLQNFLDWGFR